MLLCDKRFVKSRNTLSSHPYLLWFQASLLAVAMMVIMLLPPVRGAMLLVPLTPAAAQATLGLFPSHDVRLISRGPLPHSLIVMAERRALLGGLLGTSTLIVAAPSLLCSKAIAGETL